MSGKGPKVLSLIKVKVVRDWQDLDWKFRRGQEVKVYDTPPHNDFYFACLWGYRLIPKSHCRVIQDKGGDGNANKVSDSNSLRLIQQPT